MFAVIKTGGKQYRVQENDVIQIELLPGSAGETVVFNDVLMTGAESSVEVGAPRLKKVVEGKIVAHTKGPKLFIQKHRRRKNSKTRTGHRQPLTKVRITAIKDA
ncbi:MAG: 50S ribosomal protein L21 [Nitrospinae bacterium]|nr:50S ribosomal protein L21 [Nitrospinota bacterium]